MVPRGAADRHETIVWDEDLKNRRFPSAWTRKAGAVVVVSARRILLHWRGSKIKIEDQTAHSTTDGKNFGGRVTETQSEVCREIDVRNCRLKSIKAGVSLLLDTLQRRG